MSNMMSLFWTIQKVKESFEVLSKLYDVPVGIVPPLL